jgi:hypothetical protein
MVLIEKFNPILIDILNDSIRDCIAFTKIEQLVGNL